VEKDAYLLDLTRYLVLNPVRAGLVATPEQWPWSSYEATAGLARAEEFLHRDWILGSFAPSRALAQERYISFVLEGEGKESPLKAAKGGLILVQRFPCGDWYYRIADCRGPCVRRRGEN
jgi:putative transposase